MAKFHFCVPVLSHKMARGHWFAQDNPDGRSVEHTLNHCLFSLTGQDCQDIQINVISHGLPPLHVPTDRIVQHIVDFPTPDEIDLETYNKLSGKILPGLPNSDRRKVCDKYSKIKVGLANALADPECQFVMFVDADDMMHRHLVSTALDRAEEAPGGFTITHGYTYKAGSTKIAGTNGFHNVCGSCNIVQLEQWEKDLFAKTKDVNAFGIGEGRKKHWLFAGHASTHRRLRAAGRETKKFGLRAAIYVVSTGSNYSGDLGAGGRGKEITPELLVDFNMCKWWPPSPGNLNPP